MVGPARQQVLKFLIAELIHRVVKEGRVCFKPAIAECLDLSHKETSVFQTRYQSGTVLVMDGGGLFV